MTPSSIASAAPLPLCAKSWPAFLCCLATGRPPQPADGGLTGWQSRAVQRLIEERLSSPLSVGAMAAEIRLSRSAFARGFARSFGLPPHAYLLARRIERAKALMLEGRDNLAQIALDCGLADQAHLTRVFRRMAGTTPSAWRRLARDGAAEACPAA